MENRIALMIVGAQKAGTTSLNNYLAQHTNIYTHQTLEFGLFRDEVEYKKGLDFFLQNTIAKSDKYNPEKKFFIAKRVGLMHNEEMLLNLRALNPDVKIVAVLRNPIDRAFSAFWYCRKTGMEPYLSFEDAIYKNEKARFKGNKRWERNCDYLGRSIYLPYIQKMKTIFPPDNLNIFLFEEMVTDLNKALNEIISMIHLSPFPFNTKEKYNERTEVKSNLFSKIMRPGQNNVLKSIIPLKYRSHLRRNLKKINEARPDQKQPIKMLPETRLYLQEFFKPQIEPLMAITKLPIDKYWSEFFNEA